jgi:hypothetical protein
MNVISMTHEIHLVANPVFGESALPHLAAFSNDSAEFMGTCTFNQLNSPLDCHVDSRSQ